MARAKKSKADNLEVSNNELSVKELKELLIKEKHKILTYDELLIALNIQDKVKSDEVIELLSSKENNIIKKVYYLEEHNDSGLVPIPNYIINNYLINGHFYHPITKDYVKTKNIDDFIVCQFEILDFK